jgi:hypothetical protein
VNHRDLYFLSLDECGSVWTTQAGRACRVGASSKSTGKQTVVAMRRSPGYDRNGWEFNDEALDAMV